MTTQALPTVKNIRAMFGADESRSRALAEVVALVGAVVLDDDSRAIARLRADLRRLLDEVDLSEDARATFRGLDETLASALGQQRLDRGDARRKREAGSLKSDVLVLLKQPQRPKDLIAATGADPSLVSRALADLETDHLVVRTTAPKLSDGRGRWYVVADQVPVPPVFERAMAAGADDAKEWIAIAGLSSERQIAVYRLFNGRVIVSDEDPKSVLMTFRQWAEELR